LGRVRANRVIVDPHPLRDKHEAFALLGSIRIGSVFGIHVRVHWLFVVILGMLLLAPRTDPVEVLVMVGTLFSIVFLHELGHCLVARRFGIRVLDITFWPLGGMARMSEIPEQTKVEALIALAGPAVNFALAFLAAPVWIWTQLEGASAGWIEMVHWVSGLFLLFNLMLGVFNLVPAFPMDGGRVLRAFLGRNGDWLGATETAVRVGKIFAVIMVVFGLFSLTVGGGLTFLPLIGAFVWFAGSRELMAVRMRHAPAFDAPFGRIFNPFAAQAAQPSPAPAETVRPEPESVTDPSGARRPGTSLHRGRRLSDEDIERLERYRGPLRGFGDD
jgi:Zn-dependent protease